MTFDDTVVLSTAWINQPALRSLDTRTLLVGASLVHVRPRSERWQLDQQTRSIARCDSGAGVMRWLGERLLGNPRLLIWRGETILVPSLVAAADSATDVTAARLMLRQLDRLFAGEVIDVSRRYGSPGARSFDAVAHKHALPFVTMSQQDLEAAYQRGDAGVIDRHVATRALTTWRLWARLQADAEALAAVTTASVAGRHDGAADIRNGRQGMSVSH